MSPPHLREGMEHFKAGAGDSDIDWLNVFNRPRRLARKTIFRGHMPRRRLTQRNTPCMTPVLAHQPKSVADW
jgi:hypothetical protein